MENNSSLNLEDIDKDEIMIGENGNVEKKDKSSRSERKPHPSRNLTEKQAGEIKWILMNKNVADVVISELYPISTGTVRDLRKGISYRNVPQRKPDFDIKDEISSNRSNITHNKRALSNPKAAKIKWVAQNTYIRNQLIAKYFECSEKQVIRIQHNMYYKSVNPKKPEWNIQDEFINFFGDKVNLHSKEMHISTKDLAEIKYLVENVPVYNKKIENVYGCNTISAFKRSRAWLHTEPRYVDPDKKLG